MPTKQQPIKLEEQNNMVTGLIKAVNHFIGKYADKATANQIREIASLCLYSLGD